MGHPCPAAAAPSSLMALLTLLPPLGGLKGEPIPCPTAAKWARHAALKTVGVPEFSQNFPVKLLTYDGHPAREGAALEGVSPALRAVASDFLLAQEVTKKAFPRQSDRYAVALGSGTRSGGPPQMGHPCPAAAAPSSLMALLTLRPPLGGLQGGPIPCPTVAK
ncbi:hypothetical protein ATO46_06215 [Aeromonas schubertii]|nr:hypothetical protein ATO46_06215 [Aeromonas schubertii]